MFFLKYLEREITIHPSFFGQDIEQRLRDKLYGDMEGSCNGEYYVVCIMDIYNISPGKLRPGRADAFFTINYRAILWKPFKGETVDIAVTSVLKQGVFCEAGPLTVFIAATHMPPDMKFVDNATPAQWANNSGDNIEKGTALRAQIIGIRSDIGAMFAIARMSSAWFGVT